MTRYHVVSVAKGSPGEWLLAADLGASSDAIARCRNLAYTLANLPLPTLGMRYVLMIHTYPEIEGVLEVGTPNRFPIVDGKVVTEADLHPAARTSVVVGYVAPLPLDAFLATAAGRVG